ncbi:MAG: hypothetical protein IPQ27_13170 [Chitinophagaceae bacterium]|nr:hypothetical protein [Chitinophagaceae bacterium]
MAAEKKSKGVKVIFDAASLRKKFNKHCKSLNVSASQRMRDMMQKELKGHC